MTGARLFRRGTVAASRVQAASTVNALSLPGVAGNYASTPDSVANSIVAPIDIRVKVAMTDWTPAAQQALISKWDNAGPRSWALYVMPTGRLSLTRRTETTTSAASPTTPLPFADVAVGWVRVNKGTTASEFFSSTDGISWASLGSLSLSGGIDSSAAIEIGTQTLGTTTPLDGIVHYAEIRDGFDGPVIVKFDPSALVIAGTRDPSTLVSSTGETWTINGILWSWAEVAA